MEKIFEFGVAYYPDYIPSQSWMLENNKAFEASFEHRMEFDFKKMIDAKVSEIRIGEFAWASIEPSEGNYQNQLFDRCLDKASRYGINVIMCTPTATPPKWLIDKYPDILPLTQNGQKIHWGSRRHYDPLHPKFVEYTKKITEYFSTTWGQHPAVKGWQIDNELGHHGSANLYTDYAKKKFQVFLQEKYINCEVLNKNWFTCFWSQNYRTFEEVELPLSSWADINPHIQADFKEFCTATFKDYQLMQIEIIRKNSPGRYITHNLISNFYDLCPWEMTKDLDVVGFDHYQDDPYPNPIRSTVNFSLMHGISGGKRFKILEQQPVQVNWQSINRRFSLDWLLLWAGQSSMLGAQSMDYFSFQKFYGGAEQYHDGLIAHDLRNPRSQQERMMAASAEMFSTLANSFGLDELPIRKTPVWIVHHTKSLWSHRICSQSTDYDAVYQIDDLVTLLTGLGVGFKFIEKIPLDFSGCKTLILPGYAFEITADERKKLTDFLDAGGHLLTLPRTAMKQFNNQMSPLPLAILDSEGLYFEDYGALGPEEKEHIESDNNLSLTGYRWAEKIKITDHSRYQTIAKFEGGLYGGSPAALLRKHGLGKHIHLTFCPMVDSNFFQWITKQNIFSPAFNSREEDRLGRDVQCIPLEAKNRSLFGFINFSNVEFTFKPSGENPWESISFKTDQNCKLEVQREKHSTSGQINLPPRTVLWLSPRKKSDGA